MESMVGEECTTEGDTRPLFKELQAKVGKDKFFYFGGDNDASDVIWVIEQVLHQTPFKLPKPFYNALRENDIIDTPDCAPSTFSFLKPLQPLRTIYLAYLAYHQRHHPPENS